VPPALAVLSLFYWAHNSPAAVGVALLGLCVGLPSVALGLIVLPRGSRGRMLRWASLPLLVAFAVIFYLGWRTAAGIA